MPFPRPDFYPTADEWMTICRRKAARIAMRIRRHGSMVQYLLLKPKHDCIALLLSEYEDAIVLRETLTDKHDWYIQDRRVAQKRAEILAELTVF